MGRYVVRDRCGERVADYAHEDGAAAVADHRTTPESQGDARTAMGRSFAQVLGELAEDPEEQPALERIVHQAVEAVPGCDYCGVSLRRGRDKVETPASTDPLVDEADSLQYDLQEGPCLDAIYVDDTYVVDDLRTDDRWPRWAPRAAALGMRSILSVRLATTSGTLGGLNLYARETHAYTRHDVDVAHLYALHATSALVMTQKVAGLQTALGTRHVIGIAQGILMQRYGVSKERAFEVLRRYSQHHNLKLRDVAQELVDRGSIPAHGPAIGDG